MIIKEVNHGIEEDLKNIVVDGIDRNDHPDFADAYIMYAEFLNGVPLNEEELDKLNKDYPELVQKEALEVFTEYF